MMRKQLMLAAVAVLGLFPAATQAAESRTWWAYNFEMNKCLLAADEDPEAATPEKFHLNLRKLGLIDQIDVKKDSNGNILRVVISTRFPGDNVDVSAHYFLSEEHCRAFAQATQPNPEDLR